MFNGDCALGPSGKLRAVGVQRVTSSIRVMDRLLLIHLPEHCPLAKTLLLESSRSLFSSHTEYPPVALVTNNTFYTSKLVSPLLFVFVY